MLGFGAYSETAFSVVGSSVETVISLPPVTASLSANTLTTTGLAFVTSDSVTATIEKNLGTPHAEGGASTSSVSASLTFTGQEDVVAESNTTLTGISPALSIGSVSLTGLAFVTSDSVSAVASINSFDKEAKANITISTLNISTAVEDMDSVTGLANVTPTSLRLLTANNAPTTSLDNFDYEAIKDLYDKSRTVYVDENTTDGHNIVYVVEDNYTVYVDEKSTDEHNIVYVVEDDYTVYISEEKRSNTVYINR